MFIVKYKHHRYYPVTFFKYTRQESVEILRFNWVFWAIQIREWTILRTKGLTSVTSLGPKNFKKSAKFNVRELNAHFPRDRDGA